MVVAVRICVELPSGCSQRRNIAARRVRALTEPRQLQNPMKCTRNDRKGSIGFVQVSGCSNRFLATESVAQQLVSFGRRYFRINDLLVQLPHIVSALVVERGEVSFNQNCLQNGDKLV